MKNNSDLNITTEELREFLISPKDSGTNQILCTCPYCNKPDHFYLNKTNHLWDCKKCKEEGNAFKLLKFLGVLRDFLQKSIQLDSLVKIGVVEEEEEMDILELPVKRLPYSFTRVYSNEYLESRDFSTKDFYKYNIGICPKSKSLKDYIVVSIEEDGKCKGYVTRCVLPKEIIEEKGLLRYKNSSDTKFNNLMIGYEEITRKTRTVIIVEGFFDKVRLDNLLETDDNEEIKVLCTFGNKMSQSQIDRLRLTNVEKIILFYDLDAVGEMKKNAPRIKKYFKLEISCLLDGKDPGDAPADEVLEALFNSYEPNVFFYEKCNGRKIKMT